MNEPQKPYIGVHLLLIKDNQILLSRRMHDHLKGVYMMVAGHVDIGESLIETMVRETKEEANITINPSFTSYYNSSPSECAV